MDNKTFFRITWWLVNQFCHANFLAVPPTVTILMKCLKGNNPLKQCVISFSYCLWHVWRVSCCERRKQNVIIVCVLQSNRHQHGALHLVWTRRQPLGTGCSAWQQQESSEDLSRDLSKQCAGYRTLSFVDRRLGEISILAVNHQSRGWGRSFRTPQFDEDVLQTWRKTSPQKPAQ